MCVIQNAFTEFCARTSKLSVFFFGSAAHMLLCEMKGKTGVWLCFLTISQHTSICLEMTTSHKNSMQQSDEILSAWPMVATGTVRCLPSLPAWKRTRLQISLPPKNEHVPKNRPFYKGNFILILDMIVFGEVPVLGIPNKVTISNGWLNFARKHDRIHQVAQAQAATPPAWLTVISRRCLEWFKEGLFHWAQHVPSSPMWKEHWLQK